MRTKYLPTVALHWKKHRFSEDEIDLYLNHVVNILNCYRERFGDGAELEYRVRKRFNRIELRLVVQGEKVNLLEWTKERSDTGRSVEQALGPLVWNQADVVSHVYLAGRNIVTIASPRIEAKALHRSPMLHAAILGLACGFLCLCLPDDIRSVIVNDIAKPVQSVCLSMLMGVMVLVILVLELSIASPGTTGGWTILLAALALPADYVGMFMTYRLACTNYNAAYGALQVGLEQIEAASEFDAKRHQRVAVLLQLPESRWRKWNYVVKLKR